MVRSVLASGELGKHNGLPGMGGGFGTQQVVIIHGEGTQEETRTEVEAHIQAKSGFFEVETPIYKGDVVELDDPRGGRERRLVAEVRVNQDPGRPSAGLQ